MIDDLACVAQCGFDSVKVNAIINGKINAKRLKFNKSKCVKLHVNAADRRRCCKTKLGDEDLKVVSCVELEVQDMTESTYERYIGDMVSSDGSNDANIQNRRSQGFGGMSEIFSMIQSTSLG